MSNRGHKGAHDDLNGKLTFEVQSNSLSDTETDPFRVRPTLKQS